MVNQINRQICVAIQRRVLNFAMFLEFVPFPILNNLGQVPITNGTLLQLVAKV